MTLILTIANRNGVHQSSDYQITDGATGKFISDEVGTKQLDCLFRGLNVRLSFTGVAAIGKCKTVDWLHAELSSLSPLTDLDTICAKLVRRCGVEVGSKGILTVVLTVGEIGKPFRVVRILNSDWARNPKPSRQFRTEIRTVKKPFYLISGSHTAVTSGQRDRLNSLSRDLDKTPGQIQDELARINAAAAPASNGSVSEGCWVGSQFKEGEQLNSTMRNIGGSQGAVRPLNMHGIDLFKLLEDKGYIVPGQKPNIVQSATGSFGRGPERPK